MYIICVANNNQIARDAAFIHSECLCCGACDLPVKLVKRGGRRYGRAMSASLTSVCEDCEKPGDKSVA